MAYQSVFKRYELKYLLTETQKAAVLAAMAPHMALDQYGRTTIRNIYFDTDNFRLIRHSIEKPAYKEKLRIRSYGRAKPDGDVFVELKKKYHDVVYKRRLSLKETDALGWIVNGLPCPHNNQISNEIDYLIRYYETLHPVVFLSYEREAFYCRDGSDFRVTFDDHILCRQDDLSLESDIRGDPLLDDGMTLMEIKCAGGIPLWMAHALSKDKIFKTTFSKYGTAYQATIYPKNKGEQIYA